MKIDRSQIPPLIQQLNAALLDEMEAGIIRRLQDPTFRWATCIHEAAHYYFREKAGAVNLKFIGPHLSYDASSPQPVQAAVAGVASDDFSKFVPFREMARYCAAGYIWEAFLTDSPEDLTGAAIDRRVFGEDVRKHYSAAAPPVTEDQIEATWQWAVGEIRKDLDNPEIREDILKLAREFQVWLDGQGF